MDNAWRKLSWPAFVTAVQFLTRVPLPGGMNRPGADPALLGHCPLFFPLVGGLVGAAAGGVLWAAAHVWPPPVAIVLALIAEALLTGAFHEDAVADACDAFGGGWTRDDVLRILKDSRVGSYGALGLGLAVALRGATLGALPLSQVVAASAFAGYAGRWGILVVMAQLPPIREREGLAKDIGLRMTASDMIAGLVLGSGWLALAIRSFGWLTPVALVAVWVAVRLWGGYVRYRLDGVTGDCLGLAAYLGQLVALLTLASG